MNHEELLIDEEAIEAYWFEVALLEEEWMTQFESDLEFEGDITPQFYHSIH